MCFNSEIFWQRNQKLEHYDEHKINRKSFGTDVTSCLVSKEGGSGKKHIFGLTHAHIYMFIRQTVRGITNPTVDIAKSMLIKELKIY